MALPPSAASALGADMSSKGFGAPAAPESGPSLTEPEDGGDDKVLHEIAGDVVDAIQGGSKQEAAKFLVELVQRVNGVKGGAAAPEGASAPEEE